MSSQPQSFSGHPASARTLSGRADYGVSPSSETRTGARARRSARPEQIHWFGRPGFVARALARARRAQLGAQARPEVLTETTPSFGSLRARASGFAHPRGRSSSANNARSVLISTPSQSARQLYRSTPQQPVANGAAGWQPHPIQLSFFGQRHGRGHTTGTCTPRATATLTRAAAIRGPLYATIRTFTSA
jgi:hypothetical protein